MFIPYLNTVLSTFAVFSTHLITISLGTDVVIISNNDLDPSNPNRAGALFLRAPQTCSKAASICAQLQETLLPFPSDAGLSRENLTSTLTSQRHGAALTIGSSIWVAGSDGCTVFTLGGLSSHDDDTINPSSLLPALCTNSGPVTRSNVTSYDTTRQIDVSTPKAGILRGFRDKFTWRFLGIKYAESTAGGGRFQPPKALDVSSDSVRTALAYGPYCAQAPANGNGYMWYDEEDCLTLNVYSPIATSRSTLDAVPKLPVMFYIHGGGLNSGDSGPCPYNMTVDGYVGNSITNVYDGTNLASYGGVVVVTINYRLNAFGWFNASNAALKDVLLALHWVQDNIDAFGGNPTKVLVFGQSGGGIMTRYLIGTNPKYTQGLFNAAIVESDFSTSAPFYSTELALNASLNLAKDLGCAANNSITLSNYEAACMQDLHALDLVRGTNVGGLGIIWDAAVDGDYILNDIEGSIRDGVYARVPTLWSNIECEYCFFLPSTLSPTAPPSTYVQVVSSVFPPTYASKILNATTLYPYDTATGEGGFSSAVSTLTQLLTDWVSLCPSMYLAGLESNLTNPDTFHAVFGVGLASPFVGNRDLCHKQVCHGDDLYLVFGTAETDGLHQPMTAEQIDVMREVMKRWTEMAWSGSPNYEGAEVIWEPYRTGKAGIVNVTMSVDEYRVAQCDFIASQLGLVYGYGSY